MTYKDLAEKLDARLADVVEPKPETETEEEAVEPWKWSFDAEYSGGNGTRHSLVIHPAKRSGGVFSAIGSEYPMSVHHRRTVMIRLPGAFLGQDLLELLESDHAIVSALEALSAEWLGTQWDGSNHRGQWRDKGLVDGICGQIGEWISADLPTLCDGHDLADWFATGMNVVADIRATFPVAVTGDLDATIEAIEQDLKSSDAPRATYEAIRLAAKWMIKKIEQDHVHCECGEWSSEACEWTGRIEDTVEVEFMPKCHRASHAAARNSGSYPDNGGHRIRVEKSCAERMIEHDSEWVEIKAD